MEANASSSIFFKLSLKNSLRWAFSTIGLHDLLDSKRLFPLNDVTFLSTHWDSMYRDLCLKYRQYRLDTTKLHAAQLHGNKRNYINALTKALAQQSYRPQPACVREFYIDKWRSFYAISLTDRLLQVIFVKLLNTCLEKHLTPNCHAYRKGRNIFDAIRQCSTYIRKQKKRSKLDLYVLRSDISRYFDSIPVHDASPLWPNLKTLLATHLDEPLSEYHWGILVDLLRPEILTEHGSKHNLIGIPTGTPLTCPISNLYLHPLDEYLASIPNSYYCRYSDDFIFIHPDRDIFLQVDQEIHRILESLSLKKNLKKTKHYYLTVAGKSCNSPELKETFSGAHSFEFLGSMIKATGSIALTKEMNRNLLKHFRQMLRAAKFCMTTDSITEMTYSLCQLLNREFSQMTKTEVNPRDPMVMLRNCTDRDYLKQLDRELALAVAETVTGLRGEAAFEKISYHHIRHRYGLQSLCQRKNQGKL